jgi:uncharacterized membrane protein YfcA
MYLAIGIVFLKREYREKEECGYEFVKGDFRATTKNILVIMSVAFFGAFMAAWAGVSPAIVFGPTLLYLDVEAQVATATGMYITMFTTLVSTIQILFLHKLPLMYGLHVFFMTIFGSIPGVYLQSFLTEKFKRSSFILAIQLVVIAFILIGSLTINTQRLLNNPNPMKV